MEEVQGGRSLLLTCVLALQIVVCLVCFTMVFGSSEDKEDRSTDSLRYA